MWPFTSKPAPAPQSNIPLDLNCGYSYNIPWVAPKKMLPSHPLDQIPCVLGTWTQEPVEKFEVFTYPVNVFRDGTLGYTKDQVEGREKVYYWQLRSFDVMKEFLAKGETPANAWAYTCVVIGQEMVAWMGEYNTRVRDETQFRMQQEMLAQMQQLTALVKHLDDQSPGTLIAKHPILAGFLGRSIYDHFVK